jgi:hypothetical protein
LQIEKFVSVFSQKNERFNMQVTTSDGRTFDNFEKVKEVVKKIQETEVMKKSTVRKDGGFVVYNGSSIATNDHSSLVAQIPSVLRDMRLCSWDGKVYSASGFEEKFAECFTFLLAWLEGIQSLAGVNASVMRSALNWLASITRVSSVNADLESVRGMIRNF